MKKYIFSTLLPLSLMALPDLPKVEVVPLPFIEYHNRMAVFSPFHQSYERIKTNALYVGIEAWCLPAWFHKHEATIGEAEIRFGYNFFYGGRNHFTPLAGVGLFKDLTKYSTIRWEREGVGEYTPHKEKYRLPRLLYGTVGFLYDHEFNTIFNLGFNGKVLAGGNTPSSQEWELGEVVVGADIALPITFRFGHKRHWDVRIEPFDIYLWGADRSRNYMGFRSSVGYRF